jgi:hypothetical protein
MASQTDLPGRENMYVEILEIHIYDIYAGSALFATITFTRHLVSGVMAVFFFYASSREPWNSHRLTVSRDVPQTNNCACALTSHLLQLGRESASYLLICWSQDVPDITENTGMTETEARILHTETLNAEFLVAIDLYDIQLHYDVLLWLCLEGPCLCSLWLAVEPVDSFGILPKKSLSSIL